MAWSNLLTLAWQSMYAHHILFSVKHEFLFILSYPDSMLFFSLNNVRSLQFLMIHWVAHCLAICLMLGPCLAKNWTSNQVLVMCMQISAQSFLQSFKGSPYWMAPEVCASKLIVPAHMTWVSCKHRMFV